MSWKKKVLMVFVPVLVALNIVLFPVVVYVVLNDSNTRQVEARVEVVTADGTRALVVCNEISCLVYPWRISAERPL